MMDSELFDQVRVTEKGAICLGRSLVCDGFAPGYRAAAFTHIHRDHIGDAFDTCMHQYPVYVSKITSELLEAITEDTYRGRTQFRVVDYDSPQHIRINGHADYLKLIESSHMLGASQIMLTTHDRIKILYSGDISPDDEPPKCDVLVIDSTHGRPSLDKKMDPESLERRFRETVVNGIVNQKPICIHAHRGKLQHLMHLLSVHHEVGSDIPFLAQRTDINVAAVYNKYGFKIRDLTDVAEYEGEEITSGDFPWIEFSASMDKTQREKQGRVSRVTVSGSYGNATMKQNGEKCWIASDAHAQFTDILEYVKKALPQVVVTDGSRTGHGPKLAETIQSDLGIPSKTMPN